MLFGKLSTMATALLSLKPLSKHFAEISTISLVYVIGILVLYLIRDTQPFWKKKANAISI